MAITYKSQGAGVSTETSGAALSPLCPATVDAGDILILHIFWEGTTTAPSPPGAWTILGSSPYVIETTIARHWVYGKIADGTEDGAAIACGSPAVTTQRGARIYSFAGRTDGTITSLVNGFAHLSHATDPAMPTVTTTQAGALAVALVAQNDNNAFASPTGESGGDWVEAVAEFTVALTPGFSLGIQRATPTADPGTISGGSMATTNDPCGVIGFQIKASSNTTLDVTNATYNFTPQDAGLQVQRKLDVTEATYSFTPADVTFQVTRTIPVDEAVYVFSTEPAGLTVQRNLDVIEAVYVFTEADVTFIKGYNFLVDEAVYSFTEADVTFLVNRVFQVDPASYSFSTADADITAQRKLDVDNAVYSFSTSDAGLTAQRALIVTEAVYLFTTQDAELLNGLVFIVDPASYSFTTEDASILVQRTLSVTEAVYLFTTQDAGLELGGGDTILDVDPASYSFATSDASLLIQRILEVDNAVYLFQDGDVTLLYSPLFVLDSTVWIKFGKFSIMPCDPCAPKFIVSCLTDEPTDDFEFNVYGLANGVYYWRITEASTILTKAFNHVEGTPLSISVADVPDGFFTTKRTFLFEILKTASSENPIPFLIGQYVEQLSIDIECNIYPSNTVGEDTTP